MYISSHLLWFHLSVIPSHSVLPISFNRKQLPPSLCLLRQAPITAMAGPSWNGDGGDAWRRRPLSPFFRIVNPELYMKPNLRVGIFGTGLFVLVLGGLAWQKHSYEKQKAAATLLRNNPPEPLERIIRETD